MECKVIYEEEDRLHCKRVTQPAVLYFSIPARDMDRRVKHDILGRHVFCVQIPEPLNIWLAYPK